MNEWETPYGLAEEPPQPTGLASFASPAAGFMGRLFSPRGLALAGLALQGMGGPQGQNPLLQHVVMQELARREQAQGFGRAIEALNAAQQTSGGNRAAFSANLTGLLRGGGFANAPQAAQLLYQALQKNNEALLTDARASEESLATSQLRAKINEHATGDYNEVLAQNPDLVRKLSRPSLDALFKETEPAYSDLGNQRMVTYRAGQRRGKTEPVYTGPTKLEPTKLGNNLVMVNPLTGAEGAPRITGPGEPYTLSPGQTRFEGTAPVASLPERPTDQTRRGFEILYGAMPPAPTAEQTKAAAVAAEMWGKATPEQILEARRLGVLPRLLPGAPGSSPEVDLGNAAAGVVSAGLQKQRVDVAAATGAGQVTAKAQAERGIPAIQVLPKGTILANPTTGEFHTQRPYDTMDELKAAGFTLQLDDKQVAALEGAQEMRGMLSVFRREVGNLTKQPAENVLQGVRARVSEAMGVDDPTLGLRMMKGAVLRVAKTMQGSAQGLSNLDVGVVERFLPTEWDTQGVALRRLAITGELIDAMEGAILKRPGALTKVNSLYDQISGQGGPGGPWKPRGR